MLVGRLAGPLHTQLSTDSVVLETTVVRSVSSEILLCIEDYRRDITEQNHRILQHFGQAPIGHAKIVSLRIYVFRVRIQDSRHFVSANFDPVELFVILYVSQSF